MLNWRRSVVVHRVAYKQLFAARRCSCAWLVSVFLWILALGLPFILAFCIDGWWFSKPKTAATTREKPTLLAVHPAYASLSLSSIDSRSPTDPNSPFIRRNTPQDSVDGIQRRLPVTQQQLRGQQQQQHTKNPDGILLILGKLEWTPSSAPQQLRWSAERQEFVKNEANSTATNSVATPLINASVATTGDSVQVDLDWPLPPDGQKIVRAPHNQEDVRPKVSRCELGLHVFYRLPSFPNVVFDSLAMISAHTAVPSSGLLLRGNIVLQQEAVIDVAAAEGIRRGASTTRAAAETQPYRNFIELLDSNKEQAMVLSASTTSAQWVQESSTTNAEEFTRFVGKLVLNTTFQTISVTPTSFETAITAWTRYLVIAFPCVVLMRLFKTCLFAGRYISTFSVNTLGSTAK